MKKRTGYAPTFLLIFLGFLGTAFGFDQEDMVMHGFASQGYLKSSHNNYLGNSKDGSFEFNEIGVNFMAPVSDSLRFGVQFFSRDLGNYGNNDLIVDWALLDYNINRYLGLRAGKVKMPHGLRNRFRDVDNTRTPIVLNQAVYNEGLRDILIAVYGFNLYGTTSLGVFGDLDYDFLAGTIDIDNESAFVQDAVKRFTIGTPAMGGFATEFGLNNLSINLKHLEGGRLLWMSPVPGLSFSVSDFIGKFDINTGILPGKVDSKMFMCLSAKYDFRNISLVTEWMNGKYEFDMSGVFKVDYEISGWYSELSLQASNNFFLGVSYGEYYPDSTDKHGRKISAGGVLPDYCAWQKDTTFSSKFNVNEYLCLKFEVHYMDGTGLTDVGDYEEGEAKKHWFLYAFKTSINF